MPLSSLDAAASVQEEPTVVAGERNKKSFLTVPYVLAIVAAEAVVAFLEVTLGLVVHAVLIFALLTHYAIASKGVATRGSRRTGQALRALPALALIPLLRILSVTMAWKNLPDVYWNALAGMPLLAAGFLARRFTSHSELPRPPARLWPAQTMIALTGGGLGLGAFLLRGVQPPVTPTWGHLVLAGLVLIIFSGLCEELIFRGVIQSALAASTGGYSVLWSSVLFAAVYLGSRPIVDAAFISAAGVYFACCARLTNSIVGVCIGHALLKAGMFIVWPVLLG